MKLSRVFAGIHSRGIQKGRRGRSPALSAGNGCALCVGRPR